MDITGAYFNELGQIVVPGGCLSAGSPKFRRAKELAQEQGITITPYSAPTQAEIDAEQSAELDAINEQVMQDSLDLKALALIIMDEINLLRGQHGLAPRTPAQLKTAHRNKLTEIS